MSIPPETLLCPDHIMVVGGGRWARQITEVLCGLVPASAEISVHSRHGMTTMERWAADRGLGHRVKVFSELSFPPLGRSGAAIVVNAARDHRDVAERIIDARVPLIIEKPVALNAKAACHLADRASQLGVRLAAAHVFLFAGYLESFSKHIARGGGAQSLEIIWADAENEERYGEIKHYDAGLPIFSDWLPHVIPIIQALLSRMPDRIERLDVQRGGATLMLELLAETTPCLVRLERNAKERKRVVRAIAGGEAYELDFSAEPGRISAGGWSIGADETWDTKKRPLASMLNAFLTWAAGGPGDGRLDIQPALQSCRMIDQTAALYTAALIPWLAAKLVAPGPIDNDVRYALCEWASSGGLLSGESARAY